MIKQDFEVVLKFGTDKRTFQLDFEMIEINLEMLEYNNKLSACTACKVSSPRHSCAN